MRVVQEVGYHPSALARGLQSKPMNMLGLVLSTGEPNPIDSPYFAPLLSGVVLTCAYLRQNAMLFVGEIWSDMEHSLSIFCDGRCDGTRMHQRPPCDHGDAGASGDGPARPGGCFRDGI